MTSKQFVVRRDDGRELRAIEIQHWLEMNTSEGHERIPTIVEFMLANGHHLNRIDDDTFQIVETGQIVKRKV